MKVLKYIAYSFLFSITVLQTSCSDYLDVSDDLAAELTTEEVFNNVNLTKRFHRYIYTGIPDVSNVIFNQQQVGLTGLDNPWPSISDELKVSHGVTKQLAVQGYTPSTAGLGRWQLYKQIRQANIFMRDAHEILSGEEMGLIIDSEDLAKLKNEARFLRAYYHYLLFELYGPIPIMSEVIDSSLSDLDFYRASVDEVVTFIDTELRACLPLLPDQEDSSERAAAPTKAAAYAVLAKLHIYAASPLFNGGFEEALTLKDNQGKILFPTEDKSKWNKAVNVLEEMFEYLDSQNRNQLFTVYQKDGVTVDAAASLYGINFTFINNSNPEVLWYSTKNSWGTLNVDGRERRSTPRTVYQGFCGVGVLQEMVDSYFMEDGKTIHNSPLYDKSKEYELDNQNIAAMYKKREPRFYNDITYSGVVWQNTVEDGKPKTIYFYKGSGNDNSTANNCHTGYLLYKGLCHELLNVGNFKKSQYRPGILFRLADFYLLYAEALNHVNPDDDRILEYIDKVRVRAGISKLADISPEIKGDYDKQFDAIRHERRVELFTEGQRYFDVRRWMLADKEGDCRQGGMFTGMNMAGNNLKQFMQRKTFETRIFERKMYLYPIPQNEISKSKKLVQNPGW